jgi:hypothetical protein
VNVKFGAGRLALIEQANGIIAEYAAQGYKLTLRQLFYAHVSRNLIANTMREYKKLGTLINDGRMAGLIDWEMIEDRTRNLQRQPSWDSPEDIIQACTDQYRRDLWENQPYYVECWIEKEALAGVFERICNELRVPFFCARGYNSQSEQWAAAQRLRHQCERRAQGKAKKALILHFGDHDPSGIDMTRDNRERLRLFMAPHELELRRLALNMDPGRAVQPAAQSGA